MIRDLGIDDVLRLHNDPFGFRRIPCEIPANRAYKRNAPAGELPKRFEGSINN